MPQAGRTRAAGSCDAAAYAGRPRAWDPRANRLIASSPTLSPRRPARVSEPSGQTPKLSTQSLTLTSGRIIALVTVCASDYSCQLPSGSCGLRFIRSGSAPNRLRYLCNVPLACRPKIRPVGGAKVFNKKGACHSDRPPGRVLGKTDERVSSRRPPHSRRRRRPYWRRR